MRTRILTTILTVALVAVSAGAALACNKDKASAQSASAKMENGSVVAVPVGSSCSTSKAGKGATAANTGCDVCDEYAGCDEKLTIAGAVTQVVPLKNGVMYVYTSDSPKNAHNIQAAIRHRNDRIVEIAATHASVTLCEGCEAMRGAMVGGKLHREVVNVEGGSLTLVTSEDPAVVKAIQRVSGVSSKAAKS